MMFVARFFFFHLFESPKFLLSRGRQAEAVATVHGVAYKNGRTTWLTEEILNEIGGDVVEPEDLKLSYAEVVKRFFSKFSGDRIAPLFATRRLGLMSTSYFFYPSIRHSWKTEDSCFSFCYSSMAKEG